MSALDLLDKIVENGKAIDCTETKYRNLTLKKKYQWFMDNKDKIEFIQQAFEQMETKLGTIPDEFRSHMLEPYDKIILIDENHIGIRVLWHYRTITFPATGGFNNDLTIDKKGEFLYFADEVALLDKLRNAIKEFPAQLEAVLNKLYEKSEEARVRAEQRLNTVD